MKLLLNLFVLVLLFAAQPSVYAAPKCKITVGEGKIDSQLTELVLLREHLHQAITKGDNPIEISILKANYRKSETTLFEHLNRTETLTYDEFIKRLNEVSGGVKKQKKETEARQQAERQQEAEQMRERERRVVIAAEDVKTEMESVANLMLLIENYPPDSPNLPSFKRMYQEGIDKIFAIISEENLPYSEEMVMAKLTELKNDPNRLPNLRRR